MAHFKFSSARRSALTVVGVCALAGALSTAAVAAGGVARSAASPSQAIALAASSGSASGSPAATTATAGPETPRATSKPVTTPAASSTPAALRTPLGSSSPTAGATRQPEPIVRANGFVTASGTNLMLNGHVWQFVGYNDYRLTSMPGALDCGGVTTDADIAAMFDDIKANSGATVIRTWFNQSFGSPGNWTAFDRVLAAAAARGMKVIPSLTDQWSACEPSFPTTHYRPLSWYQSGYKSPDAGYSLSYLDFAVAMAQHYANNPTIAFWQLVNEAEDKDSINGACDEGNAAVALRSFADTVGNAMKAVDPNHLINLGTMGGGQCGTSGSIDFQYVNSGAMDVLEIHDYAGPAPLPGDQYNGVAVRIADSKVLNKPIFDGEVGLDATVNGVTDSATILARAQAFAGKMNAQFPMGLAGFVVWEYAPPNTPSTTYEVGPGDPLEAMMLSIISALNRQNGT